MNGYEIIYVTGCLIFFTVHKNLNSIGQQN